MLKQKAPIQVLIFFHKRQRTEEAESLDVDWLLYRVSLWLYNSCVEQLFEVPVPKLSGCYANPAGQALSVRPDVLNEAFLHEFREFQAACCGWEMERKEYS